jgi:hypothetical protein
MPQGTRSQVQQDYFKRMLRFIPALLRDCAFEWRFPAFEPRAWILFEVAENILTHKSYTITSDIQPFISHIAEMIKEGVRPVISKHHYGCTNGSDLDLVIGWLELLIILAKVVPDVKERKEMLDFVDKLGAGICHFYGSGIIIDKGQWCCVTYA